MRQDYECDRCRLLLLTSRFHSIARHDSGLSEANRTSTTIRELTRPDFRRFAIAVIVVGLIWIRS
jgi:hypothetical protein